NVTGQWRSRAGPDHQLLEALADQRLNEIGAKHSGKRIGTEVEFVIALEAQYRAALHIPSAKDTQPFSVVMLQTDGQRQPRGGDHAQISFDMYPPPTGRKSRLGGQVKSRRTQFIHRKTLHKSMTRRLETPAIVSKIVARGAAQTIEKLLVAIGQREMSMIFPKMGPPALHQRMLGLQ